MPLGAVAEGKGLPSNLLHLDGILTPRFHCESKVSLVEIRKTFNVYRRFYRHVFGFTLITVEQYDVAWRWSRSSRAPYALGILPP
jgi:hypothetical protein